ncbi:MAG: hypothetical protein ACP5R4_13450 [Armatimonadota bacterium]
MAQKMILLLEVLLKLENIQREVGAVQESIVRLLSEQASDEVQQGSRTFPTENLGVVKVESDETDDGLRILEECVDPEQWLADRGIGIKTKREESPLDEAFDRLCLFLGQRFESLGPFYNAVKQSLNAGGSKTLDLTGAPSYVISDTVQFAHMLLDYGFLADSEYIRNTQRRLLRFVPQSHGQVINFFTGGWLERYVLQTVRERVKIHFGQEVDPKILLNPQVVLPDGSDFEFDILVGIPRSVLWFECKTGNWQEYVTRYGRINERYMKDEVCVPTLVLLDPLKPEHKQSASALAGGMRVINLSELESYLNTVFVERSSPKGSASVVGLLANTQHTFCSGVNGAA